ncbi:MAG: sugar MFS transporter [Velocimicrobium sp.]
MKTSKNYNHTIYACFVGFIIQAIVNNFAPLLFLTFQSTYHIPFGQITILVTVNFGVQLFVDFLAAHFADKIGYRPLVLVAHLCSAVGLIFLSILPEILPNPYTGLLVAVVIYAIGGGLIEVLISPIVEACPTERKDAMMSLLHSFYCWGHVSVVLISTLFFTIFGIENWRYLSIFWAMIPLANALAFTKVPIAPLVSENEGLSLRTLFSLKMFWVMLLLMTCAGACEQAVSQWASTFAEAGLKVSKTIGDLAGPMLFAVFMGISRVIYGKYGHKIHLERFMFFSGILCLASYLLISLAPIPAIGLIGCGICGMSVGILWPGTFSLAAGNIRQGGTAMFAFLALAGDLGCAGGPTFVGYISDLFGGNLKRGILAGIVFPLLLLFGLSWLHFIKKRKEVIKG